MTETRSGGAGAGVLSTADRVEFEALKHLIGLSHGSFSLVFAVSPHPSVLDDLRVELAVADLGLGVVSADDGASISAALESTPGDVVLVEGLDRVHDPLRGRSERIEAFNLSRDHVVAAQNRPVIFACSPVAATAFARRAPDFWSGRSAVFEFTGTAGDAELTIDAAAEAADFNTDPEQRARMHELLVAVLADLQARPDTDPRLVAEVLYRLAESSRLRGDNDTAHDHYTKAHTTYTQIDNPLGQANTQWRLGDLAQMRGDYDTAHDHYTKAHTTYTQIDHPLGQAATQTGLGDLAQMRGDYDTAHDHYTKAHTTCTQIDHPLGQANTQAALGRLALHRNSPIAASRRLRDAAGLYRSISDLASEARVTTDLARAAAAMDDPAAAAEMFERAAGLYRAAGLGADAEAAAQDAAHFELEAAQL